MTFRAPRPDELSAVLDLLVARDIADVGTSDRTREDMETNWQASGFDLAADAIVTEDGDGRLVAYAAVTHNGTGAVVAPDHEGRGIGARLLAWAEQRDCERGASRHRQWIAAPNARGAQLLTAAGYTPEHSYWRMGRSLDDLGDAFGTALPQGVTLRPLCPEADAVALHALSERSFASNADYRPESFEEFRDEHLTAGTLAPELSCVAERDGELAGFLIARRWEESIALIGLLAVDPSQRERGLATAMVGVAFAACAAAGLTEVRLWVAAANARALRVYQRCGMIRLFAFDAYVKPAKPDVSGE